MSRRLLRIALGLQRQSAPTSFSLPIRTRHRCFNSTTPIVEPPQPSPDEVVYASSRSKQAALADKPLAAAVDQHSESIPASPSSTAPSEPLVLSESVRTLLPYLAAQPAQYIRIHIHGFPYLVTLGDQVRLPFKMSGVLPGDVLRLNRASILGSRDFTLQGGKGINAAATGASVEGARAVPEQVAGSKEEVNGPKMRTQPPYIDERLYECRATVLGADSEPLRIKEKTKRRNRKVKTVKSKHRYTLLRISELRIKSVEELEA